MRDDVGVVNDNRYDTMALPLKRSLGDQIVDLLRDRIVSGDIPSDTPIRQDALAHQLGVSKIPLREAFAKLEQDGLIVSQANRGFSVRPLSSEEAYDVFDLRLKIEPDAVANAAKTLTKADREAAHRALRALDQATAEGSGPVGALNRAFHMALIRPAGRLVTMQMVERLQLIAERYVVKHLEPLGRSDRAVREHDALFDAWASGDCARAGALSSTHIAATLQDLRAELDKLVAGCPSIGDRCWRLTRSPA